MKKMKLGSLITGLVGLAALLVVASSPAQAAFVVGGENGWQMSFDGMINVFAVYDAQNQRQLSNGTVVTPLAADQQQSFRLRTGLLPSIFAFNVKSPTINGVDYGARVGLYPQIENAGTRTTLGLGSAAGGGSSMDVREVFFTADSCFGQFLIGRALNLFQGQNILTDMTLMGNGVPANLTGGDVDLGFIGAGYTYATFGPQFRYTTPDYKGFKLAVSIVDPSQITGPGIAATTINQPGLQTELSYATTYPNGKMHAWLSGFYQEAKFANKTGDFANHKVSSIAGAGGVQATYGPVEGLLSGWGGQGIGMLLTQDGGDALDFAGKEKTAFGGLAHVTYTIGKAKLGVQYGINYGDRTDNEVATALTDVKKSNQAVTGGVYYSVNKYLLLVGEYTFARAQWYDGSRQDQNIGSLGTVFTW